jgi:hypothetical protein
MKIDRSLYDSRKDGASTANLMIAFADQETAESFSHDGFTQSVSVPLGDDQWLLVGSFALASLEDLEENEDIISVSPDQEFHTMPVGGPIEF